ncbi:MAG: hypothetical protein COA50_12785 [Flavobacteriaceae bacterium]|nr:MAG: hypothetical protein COA50_12785 [Flavobacteriaceae bacterium]
MKAILKHLNIQLMDNQKKGASVKLLVINNPDGTPRWICNAASKKPLFLKFYLIKSSKSQLIALGIKTVFFLGLQKIFFKTIKTNFEAIDETQEPIINMLHANWAIFTGTVGPNNKILIYEETENRSSFYKVANSQKTLSLIMKEEEIIKELGTMNPITFTFPFIERIQKNTIRVADISLFGTRTTKFGYLHQSVLSEIYARTSKVIEANALPMFNISLLRLHQLEECEDKRIPKGMLKKLRVMLDSMRYKTIEAGLCHGDFTSWNMYEKNGKLAIYDWELSNSLMPVGHDAFHYIIQQGILVDKKPWSVIKKEIKNKLKPELFLQWSSRGQLYMEEYLEFYLTINTISCLALFADQKEWHTQVYWFLNTWNEALSDAIKKLIPQRELMIRDVFDFVNGKNYAAIKFPNTAPEKLSEFSDIDLCMEREDVDSMLNYIKNHPLTTHVHICKKSFMATILVYMGDGGILSLDLIWKFKRKSLVMLNAKDILKNTYQNSYNIKQMGLLDKVRYIGLFYGLNDSNIPSKYRVYHQILINEESRLDEILYCSYLDNSVLKRDLVKCLKKEKENKYLRRVFNIMKYYLDSFKQFFFSRGLVITFSGVDGAGKSTVIENIKLKIEKKIRKRVIVLRHRPSLLPILSVWVKGKEKAMQDVVDSLPRQGKNNSFLSSLFRFLYYYTDYVLGQFYIYFKYVCRGYVVLYDRYYFDFINDSKRSNIKLPKGLIKAGYKLLIKPDLNFFLHADTKTIIKRKQELDEPTINVLTAEYIRLFNELDESAEKQYFTIENKELSQTLVFVMKETTQKLAYLS